MPFQTNTAPATAYSLAIGNAIGGNVSGGILFGNSSNNLAQNSTKLFWDQTNELLGLGIASSLLARLHLQGKGATSATSSLYLTNSTAETNTYLKYRDDNILDFNNNNGRLQLYLSGNQAIIYGGALMRLTTNDIYLGTAGGKVSFENYGTYSNGQIVLTSFEEVITGNRFGKISIGSTTNYAGNQVTIVGKVAGITDVLNIKSNSGSTIARFQDSGRVSFNNLPTSAAGLVAGDIYSNLGILTIV